LTGSETPSCLTDIKESEEILLVEKLFISSTASSNFLFVTSQRVRVISNQLDSVVFEFSLEDDLIVACDYQGSALLIANLGGELLQFRQHNDKGLVKVSQVNFADYMSGLLPEI
jgi:hypothetical protein